MPLVIKSPFQSCMTFVRRSIVKTMPKTASVVYTREQPVGESSCLDTLEKKKVNK